MARVTSGTTAANRHKKVISAAKGYYGRRKNVSVWPNRPLIRHANMLTVTAVCANGKCGRFGFSGSMPLSVSMA